MEKHIRVEHHKALGQMFSSKPQRIQTTRLSELCVLNELYAIRVFPAYGIALKSDDYNNVINVCSPKRINLPSKQTDSPNFNESLRLQGSAGDTRSAPSREDDCFHEALPGRFEGSDSEWRCRTSFTLRKYHSRSFRLIAKRKNKPA